MSRPVKILIADGSAAKIAACGLSASALQASRPEIHEASMNISRPSELRFNEATGAMLADLNELAHQVNEIRPISEDVLERVRGELLGERVYNSNAIEGNTLTIGETRLILQTKTYLDDRRKREAREAINLGAAAGRIEQLLDVDGATGGTICDEEIKPIEVAKDFFGEVLMKVLPVVDL